jgi:hypothetical protein
MVGAWPNTAPEMPLAGTVMTGSLEQAHEPGKNMVWCVTLQLAWDELARSCRGPIALEPARELATALNRRTGAGEVDPASALVLTARGDDAEEQIRRAVAAHFGGAATPALRPPDSDAEPLNWIVYAQLRKALGFSPALDRSQKLFSGIAVRGFGIGDQTADQERLERIVVCYDDDLSFVLELATDNPDELLLAAKWQPGATLADTVRDVVAHRHAMPNPPRVGSLWLPNIALNETHDFTELVDCTVTNCLPEPAQLKTVRQLVEFGLDDRGVTLKAEAVLTPIPIGRPPPGAPRDYIFDGPFIVVLMRREAAAPYFALWVNNTDLMERI